MSADQELDDQSIQQTMLVPLYGRAIAGRRFPELLRDLTAEEIVGRVDYDFSGISSIYGTEYAALACLNRAIRMDERARAYLRDHPEGTIIYLGCGLDDTFSRIDNGTVHWYNLDLPDAVAYRERFIQPSERCRTIARSMFDYAWLDEVARPIDDHVLVLAAGLFYYFEESQVRELTTRLCEHFPSGEIFFEATSKRGTQIANAMVRHTGNTAAPMRFWVDDARQVARWCEKITFVACQPYFGDLWRHRGVGLFSRLIMHGGDLLRRVKLVTLRW